MTTEEDHSYLKPTDFRRIIVNSVEEVRAVISDFEKETCSRFVLSSYPKMFGQTDILKTSHHIMWENLVPYMVVSHMVLDCRYGKDRKTAFKKQYKEKKLEQLGHDCVQKSKMIQETKKLDCPAKITVKEHISFPDEKIERDTKFFRQRTSKRVRDMLWTLTPDMFLRQLHIYLPPENSHKNHPIGEASGLDRKPTFKKQSKAKKQVPGLFCQGEVEKNFQNQTDGQNEFCHQNDQLKKQVAELNNLPTISDNQLKQQTVQMNNLPTISDNQLKQQTVQMNNLPATGDSKDQVIYKLKHAVREIEQGKKDAEREGKDAASQLTKKEKILSNYKKTLEGTVKSLYDKSKECKMLTKCLEEARQEVTALQDIFREAGMERNKAQNSEEDQAQNLSRLEHKLDENKAILSKLIQNSSFLDKKPGHRRCRWGTCKSDQRNMDKLPEGIRFIPFPKPGRIREGMTGFDIDKARKKTEKTKRWIYLCGRKDFTSIEQVNANTYVCSLHFKSLSGPTEDNPEPFLASATGKNSSKKVKRKPLMLRKTDTPKKKMKLEYGEGPSTQSDKASPPPTHVDEVLPLLDEVPPPTQLDEGLPPSQLDKVPPSQLEGVPPKTNFNEKETQTMYGNDTLSAKIEAIILKNQMAMATCLTCGSNSNIVYPAEQF